jgi:hypothetical protein
LKLPGGIDKYANLSFLRLAHRFERERVSGRNPIISFSGRRIDCDLFSGNRKRLHLLRPLVAVFLFVGSKRKFTLGQQRSRGCEHKTATIDFHGGTLTQDLFFARTSVFSKFALRENQFIHLCVPQRKPRRKQRLLGESGGRYRSRHIIFSNSHHPSPNFKPHYLSTSGRTAQVPAVSNCCAH